MPEKAEKNLLMARRIAQAVAAAGGRAYFVGGLVRDHILGRENKDVDLEIHGVTPEKLVQLLQPLGQVIKNGVSFGAFGLRSYEIDIAMPRKEADPGRGSRDFEASVDPFLGCEKASRRRDFTMNALMEDVLTGEVLDFFGGRADLRAGVIRHVDPVTFREDPLRVLRAAQFAARFGFSVAEETVALCAKMDLSELAKERVTGELEKALLKAEKPSVFFETLRRMEQLSFWFPELEQTVGVPQPPQHHPEGDVWTHTMLVTDAAAAFRGRVSEPLGFMLAAVVHDFGKAVCTQIKDGKIHNYGHETEGLPLAEAFLRRLTNEKARIDYALNLTALHMQPHMLVFDRSPLKTSNRMFDRCADPEALVWLARADRLGTALPPEPDDTPFLLERLARYRETMARPYVMGRDLIDAGLKPSERFSGYLEYAHRMRLAGLDKEDALRQTLALARSQGDIP